MKKGMDKSMKEHQHPYWARDKHYQYLKKTEPELKGEELAGAMGWHHGTRGKEDKPPTSDSLAKSYYDSYEDGAHDRSVAPIGKGSIYR